MHAGLYMGRWDIGLEAYDGSLDKNYQKLDSSTVNPYCRFGGDVGE